MSRELYLDISISRCLYISISRYLYISMPRYRGGMPRYHRPYHSQAGHISLDPRLVVLARSRHLNHPLEGCQGTISMSYLDSEISRYRDMEISRRDAKVSSIEISRYRELEISRSRDIEISRYRARDPEISRHRDIEI